MERITTTAGPLNPYLIERVLTTANLSYRARGLLLRLVLESWEQFAGLEEALPVRSVAALATNTRDGTAAVRSGLDELRERGLVVATSSLPARGPVQTVWRLADDW